MLKPTYLHHTLTHQNSLAQIRYTDYTLFDKFVSVFSPHPGLKIAIDCMCVWVDLMWWLNLGPLGIRRGCMSWPPVGLRCNINLLCLRVTVSCQLSVVQTSPVLYVAVKRMNAAITVVYNLTTLLHLNLLPRIHSMPCQRRCVITSTQHCRYSYALGSVWR